MNVTIGSTAMRALIAFCAVLAATLGAVLGYDMGGLGGAMVMGGVIGIGGMLAGALIARTALLLRRFWRVALATAGLTLLAMLTWGLYL
jgi:hypothetical protein